MTSKNGCAVFFLFIFAPRRKNEKKRRFYRRFFAFIYFITYGAKKLFAPRSLCTSTRRHGSAVKAKNPLPG